MRYLINEALLRLIKPLAALLVGLALYWIATALLGDPGSVTLLLVCWTSSATFVLLLETGVI